MPVTEMPAIGVEGFLRRVRIVSALHPINTIKWLRDVAVDPKTCELYGLAQAKHAWDDKTPFYVPFVKGRYDDLRGFVRGARDKGIVVDIEPDELIAGGCILCDDDPVVWTPRGVLFDDEDAEVIEGQPLCTRCKEIEIESLYERIKRRVQPPSVWDRLNEDADL